MSKIEKFEDFRIWNDALDVAVDVYQLFGKNGIKHHYSIKDQILRASLSISNNIAEGFEYNNNNDLVRFLKYAKGSTGEVRSMYHFLKRVNLISEEVFNDQQSKLVILSKQQGALIKYLKTHQSGKSKP